jgi:galactokinase
VLELDELVDIALATPGVVGAGLVGAGLGGSVAVLVEQNRAKELVENLTREFYQPRYLPVKADIVGSVGGAAILDLE